MKSKIISLGLALGTFVIPKSASALDAYATAVLADSPISYWRLDETSGTTLADIAGANNGTYITGSGSVTLGVAGALGTGGISDTAAAFSGGGGGGHAEVPWSAALNPTNPFTIELWTYTTDLNLGAALASQDRNHTLPGLNSSSRTGWVIYHHNGGNGFKIDMGSTNGVLTSDLQGKTSIQTNTWYHVAVVYQVTNAILYLFGEIDAQGSNITNFPGYYPNTDTTEPLEFGQRNNNSVGFHGGVDEVAIYNYALTQAQLQHHVSIGLPLKLSISPSTATVADSKPVGTAYDGNNNGGTWLASVSDGSISRNGVMQFSVPSQITVFGYPDFDATNGTIAFWMRSAGTVTTANGNQGAVLFDRRTTTGNLLVQQDDGTLLVQANPSGVNTLTSVATVSDNNWHHIAFVYDNTDFGSISLYVDGVLDSSQINFAAWPWPTRQEIEFGKSHDGYWRAYSGYLDDVRIYNRQLTGAEVASIYANDDLVDTNALTMRYNFDAIPKGYQVTWLYGFLQSATNASGPYTTFDSSVAPSKFPIANPKGNVFYRGSTQ